MCLDQGEQRRERREFTLEQSVKNRLFRALQTPLKKFDLNFRCSEKPRGNWYAKGVMMSDFY